MTSSTALPVIDVEPFRTDPASAAGREVVADLVRACHEVGFVYVVGHGIDDGLDADLFRVAREFFSLPLAERQGLAIANSAAFRGYTTLGDERTNGQSDWREQIDVGPEEPVAAGLDPSWLRLRGPNQWPTSLPEMSDVVLGWMDAMESLGLLTLRALALGLGQPIDRFDDAFVPRADPHVKVIRYPAAESGGTDQGVGAHHDTGVSTFITQNGPGLQVETPDGFVDAPPMPGAYIMNLGEMLQRATDGYLKATRHRVLSPTEGDRVSVAFFFNPRFDSVFEPIQLPPELAVNAPGGEHVKIDDAIHALFGENNLRTRLRSHPDVAERHYADVVGGNSSSD